MAKLGFTASEIASKKYVDDAIANAGGGVTVDQTYSPTSENAQSGKAVAEAVSSRVPKKSANPGAQFSSVVATNNSSYDENFIPNDESYICIDAIGDELGKDIDNNIGTFAGSIPRRDSKGNLFTSTPIDDEDCVNKKYITDNYIPIKTSELQEYQVYAIPDAIGAKSVDYLTVENPMYFENGQSLGTIPSRQTNGNIMTNAPVKDLDCANKKYVDDKIAAIPSGGGGEAWEVISDTTTEFNTPVSQIVINQDTNGNSFSLKKMKVFIDFTVSEAYTGIARAITASSNLMYITSQSLSAGTVYGYFIDSEVLPMVNNRCQIISHFNENRMSENGNNFNFEYNSGAVDYAIRTEKTTVTLLGYNVSSISNLDFRLGSTGKINKARILIFGVRA